MALSLHFSDSNKRKTGARDPDRFGESLLKLLTKVSHFSIDLSKRRVARGPDPVGMSLL
jgi:hypothetical protein